jgi:putative oxidoreductase
MNTHNTLSHAFLSEAIFRLWRLIRQALDALQSPALLLARVYVAWAFFASGLTKVRDWGTTIALFTDEYKVPLLPPAVAAFMGTAGELILPVLLVIGLATRFSALGLFVVNAVAVIALQEIAPAALQQHILWGSLLLGIAIFGGGKWTLDRRLCRCD